MSHKNPLINLFKYTWQYSNSKRNFILFVILSTIANLILLLEPIIIGRVFNSIQFAENDPNLLNFIILNLSLLVVMILGFWAFHGISRTIEVRHAYFVSTNYRLDMFKKVMNLPASWHQVNHSGKTIDKVNKASVKLFNFSERIFEIIRGVISLFGSIIVLFVFDPKATLIALIFTFTAIKIVLVIDNKYLIKGYKKVYKEENYLAAGIHDYISNIITVITLRLKKRALGEIKNRSMRAYPQFKKNNIINEWKWFSIHLIINLMIVIVLILNATTSYKTEGIIVLGTLFILYKYLWNISESFFNFTMQYSDIVENDASLRSANVINVKQNKNNIKTEKHSLPENWKTIQIKNLNFSYEEKKELGDIQNANIKITKNKKIALIGESGSGKSTLLSLLRGLHLPHKSLVYANGKKLNHGLAHFYKHITLIPQDPEIFNTTIKDNIKMGKNFSKEEIEKSIKLARFTKVLQRLTNGLDTNVMEKGVSLSGGEKQRLALARGLLMTKDCDFILLDEPTSSVDSENEILIYKNIFKEFKNKTIISSIHRLHLLQYFDYIYLFKDGTIISEGNFNTLLQDPSFKELWQKYTKHYDK